MRLTDHCSVDLDAANWECEVILDGDGRESPGYPGIKGDDFRVVPDGVQFYLQPRHKAQIGQSGTEGLAGCTSAKYATRRFRVDNLPVGTHICMVTNEGRFAELTIKEHVRIKQKGVPPAQAIIFSYRVWDRWTGGL